MQVTVQTKKEHPMTDLELISELEAKIHQLPPQVAVEVNDYIDFLLQKYRLYLPQKQQQAWEDLVRETSGSCRDMPMAEEIRKGNNHFATRELL